MDMYKLITESEDISLPIVMQKTFGALMFTLCFDAKMKGVLTVAFFLFAAEAALCSTNVACSATAFLALSHVFLARWHSATCATNSSFIALLRIGCLATLNRRTAWYKDVLLSMEWVHSTMDTACRSDRGGSSAFRCRFHFFSLPETCERELQAHCRPWLMSCGLLEVEFRAKLCRNWMMQFGGFLKWGSKKIDTMGFNSQMV